MVTEKNNRKEANQHLTNGIRYAACSAARGCVRLGHSASLHSHASLHPHFARPGLATQALIRAAKTSVTLNVICHLQIFCKTCVILDIFYKYSVLYIIISLEG